MTQPVIRTELDLLAALAQTAIVRRAEAVKRPNDGALAYEAREAKRDFQAACEPETILELTESARPRFLARYR